MSFKFQVQVKKCELNRYNPIDSISLKTIWKTDKNIVCLKKIQDDNILNRPMYTGLAFQICDPSHETIITSNKTYQNKLWSLLLNKPIVEWYKKKINLKKEHKKWHFKTKL